MKMKTRKTIRKIVSLVLAVMMMTSAFAFTASAAENNKSLFATLSDSMTKAYVNAIAEPTPEHPLTYSYKATLTAYDALGRTVDDFRDPTYSYPPYKYAMLDFYTSKDAYEGGAEPVASYVLVNDDNGKYHATYEDTFSKKPPATLYWVVRPQANVIFYPSSGTASAQLVTD